MRKKQWTFAEYLTKIQQTERPESVESFIEFLKEISIKKDVWNGLIMTPPSSILQKLITIFDKYSDFPLELPFFTFMHMLSGELLKRQIKIEYRHKMLNPQLWSILICASGGGKTTTIQELERAFDFNNYWQLDGLQSRAAFIAEIAEHNQSLMLLDEAGMNLKKMRAGQPLEQVKTDMLNISVNRSIKHKTVNSTNIEIEEPVMSFLGATTKEPLENSISWEDIYSGFCQRIQWIYADRTKEICAPKNIPLESLKDQWQAFMDKTVYKRYIAPKLCEEAFEESFDFFRSQYTRMNESYFKRVLDQAHAYALLYHIILGKGDEQVLDLEDYGWAGRALGVLFKHSQRFLRERYRSELDETLERVAEIVAKIEAQGRKCTPRDVMRGCRKIKTAKIAEEYLNKIRSGEYIAPDNKAYDV